MAEWKPFDLKWGRSIWYCSACEESTEVPTYLGTPMYNFCPMCGANRNMKKADGCKTESDSEKPNNCEHITEDGVTCAKYPACDDCLDNPLNKVKGSERLVKGKDEPTISKMEQVPSCIDCTHYGDYEVCKGCDDDYNKFKSYYEPKDEPTTQTETQNSNLTFKTLEYCDICDHKGCEECIANALDEHCMPSQFKKQIEDECAKEYEELGLKELKELIKADRKTEPTISKMEQVEDEPQTERSE